MNCSWITIMSLLVISQLASAKVVLIGRNTILSFDDVEATFTPIVRRSGEHGLVYAAEPLDACSDLNNMAEKGSKLRSSYILIVRGGCTFEEKVRKAQKAGYKAAIVYNDGYDELLVPRNLSGVRIHGLLVTRASGEVLKGYAGRAELELWLIPGFGISSWPIMGITFISLLAVSAVLATCFVVHRHRIRRRVRDLPHGGQGLSRMPSKMLQSMPTELYTGVFEEGSTSVTCAICINDYCLSEKLRILPCKHKFHVVCIDSWLGHWRSFCPVCKHNPRTGNDVPPVSATTPLLSPSPSSITSLQSFYDLPIVVRVYL
ncbi:receptor homology region, transmembrane domain- and RING domain-containing protein 5-like isoform X2 [Arabidopsis lyrata subsp. lyrata]|uniref:receptor homology region, transmembrane domain- and RING domain-containing protein 5-like isoform X2 n=1 Tax=Arabidopsis lyrata subsp. lyrata TaxID=81972 RepID=UPI000A29AD4A|nr:receptor homology region, transmembrane domain- and RING domain-containing protein 5-like isoform X2 [Arabidopsis lyrata subsp. lyrata]|eukprot:XP_020868920.1 receptor homology region, transmembrane domain- and RING domain-containing protein 5-like isoform X2 [Arabidopsis lyrata subsp. lyrata]